MNHRTSGQVTFQLVRGSTTCQFESLPAFSAALAIPDLAALIFSAYCNGIRGDFRPPDVAASLGAMARQCFSDAFAHLYEPPPFARFLEDAYGPGGRMERDLDDKSVRWKIASAGDQIIGYAKLSPLRAPAPAPQPGIGVAADLCSDSMAWTRSSGAPYALGACERTR